MLCGTDLDLGLNRIVLSKEGLQLTCSCAMSLLQVRSMPIRKDDEVLIVRGKNKGKEGKVVQVSQQPVKIETDRNRY
jgi:ribosomal protein uL24